jgi:hypothetical protein
MESIRVASTAAAGADELLGDLDAGADEECGGSGAFDDRARAEYTS